MTVFGQTITEPFIIRDYYSFFNPAYTSYKSEIKASTYAKFRNPESISWNSNFEISIPNTNFSFGSNFHRDVIGQFEENYVSISAAYATNLKKGKLRIGLSSALMNRKLSGDWISAVGDVVDPSLYYLYPSPNISKQGRIFNSIGLAYFTKKYHVGFSIDNYQGLLVYGNDFPYEENFYFNIAGGGELIRCEIFDLEVDFFDRAGNQRNTIRIVPIATIWSKFQVGLVHGIQDDVTPFVGYLFHFGKENPQYLKLNFGTSITTSRIRTGASPDYFLNLGYYIN